jgi:prepilin-type N-terminal cleavage/methylation domain-containing protein
MNKKGFTLIELLIVVAIIAILAAIAIPNFLEAQVRSKVSRAKADMRSMAGALESYFVDSNAFPQCHTFGVVTRVPGETIEILERLSTPLAYITNIVIKDPFIVKGRLSAADADAFRTATPISTATDWVEILNSYTYQSFSDIGRAQTTTDSYTPTRLKGIAFTLQSAGPDGLYYNLGGVLATNRVLKSSTDIYILDLMYDPTNGTVSRGSIFRTGGSPQEGSTYAGGVGLVWAIRLATK